MELFSIETGNFKLDGGAMFGVVPKSLWKSLYPADDNNLCNFSMRSLLVVDGKRKILLDTGVGNKQDEKFFKNYFLNGDVTLEKSLSEVGFTPDDITDVVLSHLHFDHCGGAIKYNSDKTKSELTFKNATYWISRKQWDWAVKPNRRERASFLKENILPIQESGHLNFIEKDTDLFPDFSVRLYHGHTDGQLVSFIRYKHKTLVYVSDFIPSASHIPLPYIASYDTRPLLSMQEKKEFLEEAVKNEYILFFLHDLYVECCTLKETEKGVRVDNTFSLKNFSIF